MLTDDTAEFFGVGMSEILVGTDECLLLFRGELANVLVCFMFPRSVCCVSVIPLCGSGLLDSPECGAAADGFSLEFDCTVIGASGRGAVDGDAVARLQAKTVYSGGMHETDESIGA